MSADDALDAELGDFRYGCLVPYFDRHPELQPGTGEALVKAGVARDLVERMSVGAPPPWQRDLRDESHPLAQRAAAAFEAIGMSISHGPAGGKRVATAYAAYFSAPLTAGACKVPPAIADYVRTHDFWSYNFKTPPAQ